MFTSLFYVDVVEDDRVREDLMTALTTAWLTSWMLSYLFY